MTATGERKHVVGNQRTCEFFTLLGDVPIECLFSCQLPETCPMRAPDYFDRYDAEEDPEPRQAKCKECGSTDVRWRQQGGKWRLFSDQAGVLHKCDASDDFRSTP